MLCPRILFQYASGVATTWQLLPAATPTRLGIGISTRYVSSFGPWNVKPEKCTVPVPGTCTGTGARYMYQCGSGKPPTENPLRTQYIVPLVLVQYYVISFRELKCR